MNGGRLVENDIVSVDGTRIQLRPAAADDLPIFYKWRSDIADLHLWTMVRRVPPLREYEREFERLLAGNVTLVIIVKKHATPAGFVQAYGFNLEQGWASFMAYVNRRYRRPGVTLEAGFLLLRYLFDSFPLRKLYAEVFEYNSHSLRILRKLGFQEEGRLREHAWFKDRYWDHLRLAAYREQWAAQRDHYESVVAAQGDVDQMAESLTG